MTTSEPPYNNSAENSLNKRLDTPFEARSIEISPNSHWMRQRPWRFLAFGLGTGLSPIGPGTVSTLWAWIAALVYQMLFPSLSVGESIIFLSLGLVIGSYACGLTGRDLDQPDHGGIVWDEILAFWFILFFILPGSWLVQVLAFLIFRYFDIAKPSPIKVVDQYFKNWQPSPEQVPYAIWIRGFGVMVDDILAAMATLLVLSIVIRIGVISL
jgi:phosphatidylglycerophosphatase A